MPEVVYAFATTGGSTPGASSWQKNQIVDFETSKSTSNTNKGTWQLRDKCINIICVMCSAGSAASGVGKPTFPGDFLRDRAGAHHGFQAHMGNQPTCSLEIGSPFVIKAGCALAFAAGIKTFLWKCPNFWSNLFFWEMTSCGQTKAALCRLLCPNNDSTKSLGPKCRRVGWTNQAWISHNYMSCIIILWSILMPKKKHRTSFENSMMRIFAWWTTSVARAKPTKLSARNSILYQHWWRLLLFMVWFDKSYWQYNSKVYHHIPHCKRTLPLFLSP